MGAHRAPGYRAGRRCPLHTSRYAFFFSSMIAASVALVGCGSEVEEQPSEYEPGQTIWARRFGRASESEPMGLAVDASGNVVVAGRYYGDVDFGGGPLPSPGNNFQVFVAKYAPNGGHVYSRSFGDFWAEKATDVALLPDGSAIVVGSFAGFIDFGAGALESAGLEDAFVVKLGPDGETVWAKRFGGLGAEEPRALAVTPDGGLVVLGKARGQFDVGGVGPAPGATDSDTAIFTLRLDPAGAPLWARTFVGFYPEAFDIAARADGGAVLVGYFNGSLTLSPTETLQGSMQSSDAFVVALDGEGALAWRHAYGTDIGGDAAVGVTIDPAGQVLVTGDVTPGADLGGGPIGGTGEPYEGNTFLLELDEKGGHVQDHLLGRVGQDSGGAVAVDAAGDVLLAGTMLGSIGLGSEVQSSRGGADAFVAKMRRGGSGVFLESWGNVEGYDSYLNGQYAYQIAADGAGNAYVLGSAIGAVDFGVGAMPGTGYYDAFLLKLAP